MSRWVRYLGAYASLCNGCEHLSSRHLWSPKDGGDLRQGPYRCLDCECETAQSAPSTPLSKRQYEAARDAGLPTYETGPR